MSFGFLASSSLLTPSLPFSNLSFSRQCRLSDIAHIRLYLFTLSFGRVLFPQTRKNIAEVMQHCYSMEITAAQPLQYFSENHTSSPLIDFPIS